MVVVFLFVSMLIMAFLKSLVLTNSFIQIGMYKTEF